MSSTTWMRRMPSLFGVALFGSALSAVGPGPSSPLESQPKCSVLSLTGHGVTLRPTHQQSVRMATAL